MTVVIELQKERCHSQLKQQCKGFEGTSKDRGHRDIVAVDVVVLGFVVFECSFNYCKSIKWWS